MIVKLLYFVLSLIFIFAIFFKRRSFILSLKTIFLGMFFVYANSVSGQITQQTAWTSAYDQTNLTGAGTSFTIAPGANRVLVVAITTTFTVAGGGDGTQADPAVISYGGIALAKATGNGTTSGRVHTWLYYLKDNAVMDNTSRALNVTGGTVTSATLANMKVWYGVFANVDQSPATYTAGNGFDNSSPTGATAKLTTAMGVNANEQAIYISNFYNDTANATPTYTINANWASGGVGNGGSAGGGNPYAWRNQVANRSIPGTNTTDLATTSALAPNGNIRYAMSAMSLPRAIPVITGFSPANGCVGSNITINGTNLAGATAANVTIGGTAVAAITSNTANQIVAVIGAGTTGLVSVTTSSGTATSGTPFTVPIAPTTSSAGPDQTSTATAFTLAANTPAVGTGAWSIVSGPSTALSQFSNITNPVATFTPGTPGRYVLRWTITIGGCSSTDDVVISNCDGNLIVNGNFTAGNSGWTGAVNTVGPWAYVETGTEGLYYNNGNQINLLAELDLGGSLGQDVTVVPGVSYTLSFLYARRPNAGNALTNGVQIVIIGGSNPTTANFTTTVPASQIGSFTFVPTNSSIRIEILNHLATNSVGTMIDDIVLIPTAQVAPVAVTTPGGSFNTINSCAQMPNQLDVENVPATGVTYAWASTSPGAVFSSTTIKNPTITFASWASAPQDATVVVTTAGGCASAPSTVYFRVFNNLTISGTLSVCMGGTTTLTGSQTPHPTTPWSSASPGVATIDNAGIVTAVSVGTSVITFNNDSGCSVSATVTINALPTISGTLSACAGSTTTLTGTATPHATTPWTSASPGVATVSNSGVVTGVSAGTSVITYRNSNNCTTTATVTINALPTISGTLNTCIGSTTTLTGSGTPHATTPWTSASPGVATVNNSGVVTGVSAGTSVITYRNSNGCTRTATVTINTLPTISGTLTACAGSTTTLTGSGTPHATTPWSSASTGVATVNNSGVVTGVSAGTSVITYMNSNGCTRTATVTINGLPTISGTLSACVGSTTTLTGSGTAHATTPWTSATTAVATVTNAGVVTGVSAGTSVITYRNSNNCTTTVTVTINALPTISGTLSACVGSTTTLTGSATPHATMPWSSASPGVATVNNSGVVTGVSAGTSVITYRNSNGCTRTATVTINALPTITGTLGACVGSTTTLTGSGTAHATTPWTSASPGVATVNNSGIVTGVSAGTSVITYMNSNGCTRTATVTIMDASITGTLSACVGSTTTLTGSGITHPTTPWSSVSPAVATVTNAGVVTGVSAGTSVITYRNSNNCTTTVTVTINALPTISGTLNACVGSATTLTGSGTPHPTTPWSSASTGIAMVDNAGVVSGVSAGTSIITYRNNNGCTVTTTVTINAIPSLTPIGGGAATICVGATTPAFTHATPSGTWSINNLTGSATITTAGVVTGVSAGTVDVVYTYSDGNCSNTATAGLVINAISPAPTAGTPSRPTCALGASVMLGGLPSSGNVLMDNGTIVTSIPFTSGTPTITGLVPGTYRFALDSDCTPIYSPPVVVLANIYTGSWSYGSVSSNDYVDFASNYTIGTDETYCSVTVSNNATVGVAANTTLTVKDGGVHVTPGSSLIFEDSSSLMQMTPDNTINTGDIIYKRKAYDIRQADYTYWSTPVYNQTVQAVSPLTDPSKVYAHNGAGWIYKAPGTIMVPGKGYIIRGPESFSNTVRAPYEASFIGTPINGTIVSEVMIGNKFYLIGNPYPSALSADDFIADNSNLTGTLYFWTHNTPVVLGGAYQYGSDDYAVYNLSGGTGPGIGARAGSGDDNVLNNNNPPSGKIGAGQGFFAGIETGGTITFTNDQRIGGVENGQFFKPGKSSKEAILEKHRVWLNMANAGGAFKQMLVAYVKGATNSYDKRYDGKSFDANKYIDFYSVNEGNKLAIQGRGLPFTDIDEVQLGYRTAISGEFTISIGMADGKLASQKIYIEDKTTGLIHDLTAGNYTFKTEVGTFTDRLVLRYTNKSLGTGDFENIEKGITVAVKDKTVKIVSSNEAIQDVAVFDVAGKLLYTKKKVGASELQISNLQSGNQVLLIDITLENGYKTTRKIIF